MKVDIRQLEFIDEKLRNMALWIESVLGVEMTVTSLYRIGDNGVHGQLPLRGLDLRCRDLGVGKTLEQKINEFWKYDYARPELKCCLLHGEGHNLHLHLQVHPNTSFSEG